MAQLSERKFGTMPDWANRGPVTLRNYPYRAEAHCAAHRDERNGEHPTIKRPSPGFSLWRQYFETHLGGLPAAMERLLQAEPERAEMTVPEREPTWFDPSFEPDLHWVEREYVQMGARPIARAPIEGASDYHAMVKKHGVPRSAA